VWREDFCLHQDQECEADELGMHISLAAGCSPEDMVDSMSNTYCARLTQRRRAMEQTQRQMDAGVWQQLCSIFCPDSQIPAQTFDGRCVTGAQLSLRLCESRA